MDDCGLLVKNCAGTVIGDQIFLGLGRADLACWSCCCAFPLSGLVVWKSTKKFGMGILRMLGELRVEVETKAHVCGNEEAQWMGWIDEVDTDVGQWAFVSDIVDPELARGT